ncbi:MAG: KH domain-containing protein [Clostridiales bacterium]|nr:KH domain-containing protein [Clostridiales bacterium]
MKYEFIGNGKTREEASESAKALLMAALAKDGITAPNSAEIHEEVIALPKKKILGLFGGSDAEVKVSFETAKDAKKPQQKKNKASNFNVKKNAVSKPSAPKQAERVGKAEVCGAEPIRKNENKNEDNQPKITEADIDMNAAISYFSEMIKGLKVEDAEIKGAVVDGMLEISVDSEDCGIIIGRRGETLDALQYLTSLAVKKISGRYVRVVLNVANYREKRTQAVQELARKNAEFVLRTGRRHTFEPMNPYERRIIHTTVQEYDGVESMSIGFGADRRVVIQPAGGVKYHPAGNSSRRHSGSERSSQKQAAQKDFTKFGKIEVNKD